MRKGVNPEKYKNEQNQVYYHRVIIPVYIPNTVDDYYSKSIQVFDFCLNSLSRTINLSTTAITIINNNSCDGVNEIVLKYQSIIDKYVCYRNNKGKVYTVYSEAKSAYEPFITIADADVFFFTGWEREVFSIFNTFKKAGVVSPLPLPNMALYNNASVFFDSYFRLNLKYDKVIADKDFDMYLLGMGNHSLLKRTKHKYNWREKHYYLDAQPKAIIGAGHFVATYKKEIFKTNLPFPEMKFKKGYEELYLDNPSDRLGWYRLSTVKTFAFHMGGEVENFLKSTIFEKRDLVTKQEILGIKSSKKSLIPYPLKRFIFKILLHLKKL